MKKLIFKIEMGKSTVTLRWKDTYSISKNKGKKKEEFNTAETVRMEEKSFSWQSSECSSSFYHTSVNDLMDLKFNGML